LIRGGFTAGAIKVAAARSPARILGVTKEDQIATVQNRVKVRLI